MLHQCGHGNGGGAAAPPCSCGFLHGGGGPSFSILFPVSGKQAIEESGGGYSSPSSSSVDCTLSLGTPSTRQTARKPTSAPVMSSLCWDIISQSGKHASRGAAPAAAASGGGGSGSSNLGGDPLLLARRCANCDTTSTPLWRNGPRGPKSLCNACGIRYKKEERRAAASSSSPSPSSSTSSVAAAGYGYQRAPQQSWSCYAPAAAASPYDVDGDEEREAPYLSWRLNVVPTSQFSVRDRPSLFQYQ